VTLKFLRDALGAAEEFPVLVQTDADGVLSASLSMLVLDVVRVEHVTTGRINKVE
jgi:hypothetical protein